MKPILHYDSAFTEVEPDIVCEGSGPCTTILGNVTCVKCLEILEQNRYNENN